MRGREGSGEERGVGIERLEKGDLGSEGGGDKEEGSEIMKEVWKKGDNEKKNEE